MGVYARHVLPRIIANVCGREELHQERGQVVPQASGRVLEVGVGGGFNMRHYDPGRVTEVVGLDPSGPLLERARKAHDEGPIPFQPLESRAETIQEADNSFDSVVATYTLCSVEDPVATLTELRRVLRPGGSLLFCEHGAAPDQWVRRAQEALNPLWKRVGGGCHLNRDTPALLRAAGFRIDELWEGYSAGSWRIVGYRSMGRAS